MKLMWSLMLAFGLAGCGAETVGSAATVATLKKEEAEQAKRQREQFQQKLDAANQQIQQRAAQAEDAGR